MNPLTTIKANLGKKKLYLTFLKDFRKFKYLADQTASRFAVEWQNRYPCLDDNTQQTGFDRHYVYHPAWAARVLKQTRPAYHIDISSTLHFCTIVSAFVPVQFYDYRPADLQLSELTSEHADLLALPFASNSVVSLSCMHVVEHIGLGRYGDPLNPNADLEAMAELKRVLAPGGSLLFVTPIGKPKLMFNAHRIYSYRQIISHFDGLQLRNFALVPDNPRDGGLINHATEEAADKQRYGCGCFWFVKET